MALYIPHSIFQLARLLYVRPETFGPYYVHTLHRIQVETVCLTGSVYAIDYSRDKFCSSRPTEHTHIRAYVA